MSVPFFSETKKWSILGESAREIYRAKKIDIEISVGSVRIIM